MKKRYLFLATIFFGLFLSIIFFDTLNHNFSKLINNKPSLTDKIVDDPDNPFINYRIGIENYKKKKYVKARAFFQKAADFFSIEQKKQKSYSYAHSGNCGLRISEILIDKKEKRKEAREKAIEILKKTIQDYDESLTISVSEKVEKNKLIAEELLKKLQEPQTPQDKSQNGGNDGGDSNNDENEQKEESSGNDNSNKKNNEDNSDNQEKGKSNSKKNNRAQNKEKPKNQEKDPIEDQEDQADQGNNKTTDQEDQEGQADQADQEDKENDQSDQNEKLNDSENNMNSEDKNSETKKDNDSTFLGIDDNYLEESDEKNSTASLNDKTKDEVAENKQSMLKKILSQRSEAEFKTLEEKESSLRKKRIEGITSKNTGASGKGW